MSKLHKTSLRVLAVVAAIVIVLVALWGVLFILLSAGISAQAPDPFVADGDPCCGHPDTWGEVRAGIGWTLALVVVDGLLLCVAVALLSCATRDRWPQPRRLARIPGGALVAAMIGLIVVIAPQLDEGRTPPDCDDFAFTRSAWRSSDDTQLDTAYGIAHCGLIDGDIQAEVRRLLGRPAGRDERGEWWQYRGLAVFFADGRVIRTDVGAS